MSTDPAPTIDGPSGPQASRAGVGYSETSNSRLAGEEAARQALDAAGGRGDLALVFATGKVDHRALSESIRSVLGPDCRLLGGSAVGVISNDRLGYEGHQVGVAVLNAPDIGIDVGVQTGLDEGELATGTALGRHIRHGGYRSPNILIMYDAVRSGDPDRMDLHVTTPLLKGMTEALGGVWPPAAGLGMLADLAGNPTYQLFDAHVKSQTAMVAILHGGVRMDTTIIHGCRPSGGYYAITRSNGKVLYEIEGRRAVDVVRELLGPDQDDAWIDFPIFVTFGINRGDKFGDFREDDYSIRLPMAVDRETGALVMAADDLTEGTEIQLMRRNVTLDHVRTRASALLASQERKPFFALYIDCAARAGAYCGLDFEEATGVQEVLADVPLLGMYSGVEIARVDGEIRQNNMTGVLCLFSDALG